MTFILCSVVIMYDIASYRLSLYVSFFYIIHTLPLNSKLKGFVSDNVLCNVVSTGRDNSVGIVTRYGLESLGIESQWGGGEIFSTPPGRL